MDIIVYGTGKYANIFMEKYGQEYNIIFWIDGNPEKEGMLFFGKPICLPEVVERNLSTPIIIAIKSDVQVMKIYTDLMEKGCTVINRFLPERGIINIDRNRIVEYRSYKPTYWDEAHKIQSYDAPYSCTSQLCNQGFFDMPFFLFWAKRFMPNFFDHIKSNPWIEKTETTYKHPIIYHRKLWEWVYIAQAVYERGLLKPGKKGLAFGVGEECTPDLFASYGCKILATDLGSEQAAAAGWIKDGQNAGGNIRKLNKYKFCNEKQFEERVSYRDVDMNDIPDDIRNFDFCWSACALEHLGGLKKGIEFIKNSLNTLRSGGIAVHTTEYNLSSNDDTVDAKGTCIYRKCDIENLVKVLEAEGHYVYPLDLHIGNGVVDNFVDLPPYGKKDMHLRLLIAEYSCTSIGIIIRKK